jgi:hypothetical protein
MTKLETYSYAAVCAESKSRTATAERAAHGVRHQTKDAGTQYI